MRVGDTVPIWYMTNTNFEDVLARALVSTRSEAMSTWTNYSLKEEKLTDDTLAAVKGNMITALQWDQQLFPDECSGIVRVLM